LRYVTLFHLWKHWFITVKVVTFNDMFQQGGSVVHDRPRRERPPLRVVKGSAPVGRTVVPSDTDISLVIPAYNEARRLPRTLAALHRYGVHRQRMPEIIVVDDGSNDETAVIAEQAAVPDLRVIRRPHCGKGAAVRAGIFAASHPYIILCDADLSMPPEQIDRLVRALEGGTHVAVGSREAPGARRFREPLLRHMMGRWFNLLVRLLVLNGLQDTQCGFKGFERTAARDLFARQQLHGFSFDVEVLFLARQLGYRMCEVPIDWYFDADSRVRAGTHTLEMARDVLRIRYYAQRGIYRRERRAAHRYGAPSSLSRYPTTVLSTGEDRS
jgi:dolichyl-phosphate beta-glucosyltransferase